MPDIGHVFISALDLWDISNPSYHKRESCEYGLLSICEQAGLLGSRQTWWLGGQDIDWHIWELLPSSCGLLSKVDRKVIGGGGEDEREEEEKEGDKERDRWLVEGEKCS